MSQTHANALPADHGVFASYEAAVAWMDSQCDESDEDGGDAHTICDPVQSNIINLTASDESDDNNENDNEDKPSSSPAVKHEDPPSSRAFKPAPPTLPEASPAALPPSSQSYFEQRHNFKPDPTSSFADEFRRCMLSQGVVPGSQEFKRQRTHAISHEIKFHYSQAPAAIPEEAEEADKAKEEDEDDEKKQGTLWRNLEGLDEDSPEFRLGVYQNLCLKVGLAPRETIIDCAHDLKTKVWVNIPDFIDTYRTGAEVRTAWPSFLAFSAYCLVDENRMDLQTAKEDEFLTVLLQKLDRRGMPSRKRTKRPTKRKLFEAKVEREVAKRLRMAEMN